MIETIIVIIVNNIEYKRKINSFHVRNLNLHMHDYNIFNIKHSPYFNLQSMLTQGSTSNFHSNETIVITSHFHISMYNPINLRD